ncbi:MAG: hypothetical protein M3Q07_05250 [Pseudobdellovibrionaceae bacterium]|nr:hypothetical protein [Pseudobdellovibrionaceae bacterium]
MAAAAEKLAPAFQKNRLFVTVPGYEYSHYCYASYAKNRRGGLRPVIPADERPKADLIHTTLWYERLHMAILFSTYIDCDHGRCLNKNLLHGKINVDKLRSRIVDELGEAAKFTRLVRSKSGRGIHVWIFFPGVPVSEASKDTLDLIQKIQSALQILLEDFGADPNASGLERWGTNWKNTARAIDDDIDTWQNEVRKTQTRVLSFLYRALKSNPKTLGIFLKPLTRFYPDQRVSRKMTMFVASNLKAIESGEDICIKAKDLLAALGISKNTLPELLSSPVGESTTRLRGVRIERDLERRGHYLVSATSEFSRVRHLAEAFVSSSQKDRKSGKGGGQAIMIFVPTTKPEAVADGDRNRAISHVYLKLKWHGCKVETAHRIVCQYIARMRGAPSSTNAARYIDIGSNIYKRYTENDGCRPGIAEDWLTSLASNKRQSTKPSHCPKSPKGELVCSAPWAEKNPPPTAAGEGDRAGVKNDPVMRSSIAPVVSMEEWRRKGHVRGVLRHLARSVDIKASVDQQNKSSNVVSRRIGAESREPPSPVPLSRTVSDLIMTDRRFTKEKKAQLLEELMPLVLTLPLSDAALETLRHLWPHANFDN